jgi:hypothetical protein
MGIIDMPQSHVKLPGICGGSWSHYHYLLTGMVKLSNYDIALFRNRSSLVTAGSSESHGKLTMGIIDMPESPVTFPGRCGGSWSHCQYLHSRMVELSLHFSGMDETW